jgi:hypothetical protein
LHIRQVAEPATSAGTSFDASTARHISRRSRSRDVIFGGQKLWLNWNPCDLHKRGAPRALKMSCAARRYQFTYVHKALAPQKRRSAFAFRRQLSRLHAAAA